ncbi:MAG: ArsR family transcriptional regulator, nickel/cobalt-responsive transcriptional repressor [Solirubrobacteraceae bacterium]|jgi:DNA-binding transcriptional ArsR family regulator|nr:ArsR family transcriptional regulator, nickel/cobalt-responsive transcriptional repressor [Solirubrobacteraceae bacterium]MEA2301444.1 ArsR family transcriptional regulator, nickel/cobalt-responsive transcriptional repressor [Solirubrobacteraceae bacterium]MEA2355714.1 ArsR family transcriptional regulator, nickel/cobalt-responsive transcriptional repressor [Solirubrobacteraceae bacterium]
MSEAHAVTSATPIRTEDAHRIARLMAGLGTASRVRILGRLREGPCSVGELTLAVEMAQPAVSHQLRILRDLGLVVGRRDGRHTIYGLHDSHVAMLLDESLRHVAHLRAAAPETPWAPPSNDNGRTDRSTMTDEHAHEGPHAHEHDHDGEVHAHAHTAHEHEHVEHAHEHEHDGEVHVHPHPHEAGLEEVHEHQH